MASARALAWLGRLIWILIYGGLFSLVLGLATRVREAVIGWTLIVAGAVIAATGVVLIWVRSRFDQTG
jgi:hypothetical protein